MRVPAEEDFTSRLRSPAVAARIGIWLGVCFGLAFVTGLISHFAQVSQSLVPVPGPARRGATGSPRECMSSRARRRSRCSW